MSVSGIDELLHPFELFKRTIINGFNATNVTLTEDQMKDDSVIEIEL